MKGGIAALCAWALLVAAGSLSAQLGNDPDEPAPRASASATVAVATRVTVPIVIDGRDAEAAWRSATSFGGFRQYSPEQDADPSQATEFRVLYSDDAMYFFVRAYDTAPDSIMRALSRRDSRAPSDQIGVIVDSYDDRRTGFSFYVNPDGVLRDFAIYDDGNEDSSWNGVWEAAAQIDSLGWSAEFRIPLSQLRYANADRHVFGFGVRRSIERHNEQSSWPVYSRTTAGLVSQLGRLTGLEGLGAARRIELSPYFLTKNVTRADPSAGGYAHVQELAVGGDLKVGFGPNVTLDATVNPDFGQVEADPAVLNLSAFETFFSEKRPFFLEGTGLYGFPLNCYIVVDCSTNEGLFYSRRIGRPPSLSGLYGDPATPTATPIHGAMKLTGRRSGGLSFGVLDAFTGGVSGTQDRTVEPAANYAVFRVRQDLKDGDAGIGWIGTAVNRFLDDWTRPYLHESAFVTGADGRMRFGDRKYEVQGSFALSRVAGSAEAIGRTQRSSAHYYQQPSDDLELDSTRTSLGGFGAQVKVGKYAGGITRFETSYVHQSGGFEPNDLGFLQRADLHDWSTWAALSFQDPTRVYRWAQVNGNTWHRWNTSGTHIESAVNFNAHMGLHNNWNFHAGGTLSGLGETYCDRCTRGGPVVRRSRELRPWFGVNGDSRMVIAPGMWVNLGYWDEGASSSYSLSPYVQIRLSSSLRANIGGFYYRAGNDSQWFGNVTDPDGGTHYTFAHLHQRTVSVNARINYTLSPTLSFEFYGEPFTSSGLYTNVREVVDPEAAHHSDRYAPYAVPDGVPTAFTARQLRTNTVLRWEYRPGSALFLVWTHGREAYVADQPRGPWQEDFSGLMDLHPDNTFLIKVTYWFNP